MKTILSMPQAREFQRFPFVATHPLVFSLIVLVVSTANLLSQRLWDWVEFFMVPEIGFSLLALLMPWVAAFLYHRTRSLGPTIAEMADLQPDTVLLWFEEQADSIFHNFWMYPFSLVFSLAAVVTLSVLGIPWLGLVRFFFLLFWGLFMFVTGTVGFTYGGLLVLLHRVSGLPVKGEPFEWPQKEIKVIHDVYLQMFIPGVLLYAGIVAVLWLSGGEWVALNHPLGQLWIFPIAAAVIGFFLASQYYVHRLMARSKQRRLDKIDKLVKETYDRWLVDRATDKSSTVTELLNWRSNVNQERDWPLNLQSNLTIVTGLLLPTMRSVLGFFGR